MDESVAREILAAHADRLNREEDRAEDLLWLLPEADADLAELLALAVRVKQALPPVRPSLHFREELRRDLIIAYRQQLSSGAPLPVWVDYARRHLPEWPTPHWPEWSPPQWPERPRPAPRSWVIAALGLTGVGVWAYFRHREEQRRDIPAA